MKSLLFVLLFFGGALLSLQAQSGCPNNLITNGDAELGNPTRNHEDIANATGFGPIWGGANWAEHYPSNFAPAGFTPPAPADGNYISCWIANHANSRIRFREGFKGSFPQPIAANSGDYDLTFDIACLGGWGNAEIAVYGLYDPNSTTPNRPTAAFTPSNLNLFGANNTVLLGTIPVNLSTYNHNKVQQIININSSNFPTGGITHFFVTNSDNNVGGIIYTAFDNFCMTLVTPTNNCGIVNGDAELGTPTLSHEDIANATGFGPIWSGSNWAEHYPSYFAPAGFTPPAPADGNYISCWMANHANSGIRFREGFKASLTQAIAANSGSYDLTFDLACLGGWGNAEVAVYGVYDPNNTQPNRPTAAFTPSNLNLFGPNNTVLLGTIPLDLITYDHNKVLQTITFATGNFPANGITHFFVTNSDNNVGGLIYTAFDNFCITPHTIPSCNIVNGDAEDATPTLRDEDIDRAVGYSSIWSGSNWAEVYPSNFAPAGFTPPAPADGNYISCWMANNANNGVRFREGFKASLAQPIAPNSGSYDLTFDIACLGGWGNAEVAIYGVYNPNNTQPPRPTGPFTPSNLNLFGPNNTVLLGTIPLDLLTYNHNKVLQTITFGSGNLPANGITHFFVTNSDNNVGGVIYTAFDNFCITPSSIPSCYIVNGDAEDANPTLSHQDIDSAVGYSPIWTGHNWAEVYPSTFAPAGFTPPAPADGNYISCWMANNANNRIRFRESFQGSLAQPIASNSGWYDLTFDMACLGGWGNAEVAVYGVYNPNQGLGAAPTGPFTPSNLHLFGPTNTVLLGTIPINLTTYDHNKALQTIVFNSSSFPANGITHFFVTNSDNNVGGLIYTAFDNFCITPRAGAPEPCPEVTFGAISCIPDVNGDRIQDYEVVVQVQGTGGSISFATNCGRVSPSNLVLTGQSSYTLTIMQNSNCASFNLSYSTQLSSGSLCPTAEIELELPDCQPTCPCDLTFVQTLRAGFTYSETCTRDYFQPNATLTPCDEVNWYLNGNLVGSTIGNNRFALPHQHGNFRVCMEITRINPSTNRICSGRECLSLSSRLNCLTHSPAVGSISAFPNPVQHQLRLRWDTQEVPTQVYIELYNSSGILSKRLDNINGFDGEAQLDLSDLPTGFYWLHLKGEAYQPAPIKIIKR